MESLIMRHLLMDPAFPDIVGQWAAQQKKDSGESCNRTKESDETASGLSNLFLRMLHTLIIAAARLW